MIFQADAVLQTIIRLLIDDLRNNIWLIDHILKDFTSNPYLKKSYGQKQVDACKEWFLNNQIDVYSGFQSGKIKPPCVSIGLGPQKEKIDMKFMGDKDTEEIILLPKEIGKPIAYMVKPFVPTGYNEATGELGLPESVEMDQIAPGMLLLNPDTGIGYTIESVMPNSLFVSPGLAIDASKLGILPRYPFYKARIEHIYMDVTYNIICTAHGDAQNIVWLHDIILYGLLRYKESLLEALGLSETVMSSSELQINQEFGAVGADTVWDRAITVEGQLEQTFLKEPHRLIEVVNFKKKIGKGCKTGYTGGIVFLANKTTPSFMMDNTEPWTTEEDDDSED